MTVSDHEVGGAGRVGTEGDRRTGVHNPTRQKILDAAVACILESGFYRASSNEIARRAGVTWGAIQRQFGTREALMLAAFEEEWQRLLDVMGTRIDGDTAEARVRSLFAMLKQHYSRPEYFAAVQIVINLRQDPKATKDTLDVIEEMSRRTGGMLPRLLHQILPGARFDSAVAGTLFFTIRDFYIGLHVESATTLAEAFQDRLDRLADEEELVIDNLVALVRGQSAAARSATRLDISTASPPAAPRSVHAVPERRDGVSAATLGRRLLAFAVAKLCPRPGGGVEVTYLCDAGEVRHAYLSGVDSVVEPGTYSAVSTEGDRADQFELTIHRRGGVFDLEAAGEDGAVRGLGMIDPENPAALLVSWSWGDETATGIVKYVIDDEPHTIVPTYTSHVLAAGGFDDVKGGRATGRTTDGFPGTYSIVYDGIEATYGPFTWTITERGVALELTWDTGTRRAMEGFGFHDPDSERSIVVVYWSTGPRLSIPDSVATNPRGE